MADIERKALYAELQGLTEAQWSTMTVCDPWTVRHLVAHMTATHGDGPEVVGPGMDLIMAMSGRAKALDNCTGDGVATMRARC